MFVPVDGEEPVFAIADEDLNRENDERRQPAFRALRIHAANESQA
jgi:hypothetical protein